MPHTVMARKLVDLNKLEIKQQFKENSTGVSLTKSPDGLMSFVAFTSELKNI